MEEDNTKDTEDSSDLLSARLDAMEDNFKGTIDRQAEVIAQQAKAIAELKSSNQSSPNNDEDEGIITDRKSAHTMRMPVVGEAPIISGKLERIVGVPGIEYIMRVNTAEVVSEKDGVKVYKEYLFPFGCNVNQLDFNDKKLKDIQTTSYENIKTKDFDLQDIDMNDLTGASKVKRGEIVGKGNNIPEIDRSSGRPVFTGRKIQTVVRRDIRYYTIMFNGEKVSISSQDLGNIRI